MGQAVKKGQMKAGVLITYISNACSIISALLITPIILSLIGQEEYGLYSLVYSIMGYFSVLDFGFGNAMVRYISRYSAEKKDDKNINSLFFIIYCIIGIITVIIGGIIYANVEEIFGASLTIEELDKTRTMILIFLASTAISFPLSVFDSYVLANEKFVFLRLINLLKILLYPVLIIPILLLGYKSVGMVITYSILNLMTHVFYAIYSIIKLKMRINFNIKKIDFSIFGEIIGYSFFVFLNLIVDTVFNNTDQVILGIVSGTVAVSIYSVANQVVNANSAFSTAISGLFLPKITKLLTLNKKDEVNKTFIKVSKIQLYIMLLILSGFYIFGKVFILLWVGNEYMEAYYIVLLKIGIDIIPLTQNIGISVLQAMNKHKFRAVTYILIAVINIGVSIPLAKLYNGIGAAIGTVLAVILGQIIIMNIYYYKVAKLDIPMYWKNFLKVTIPVIIFSILVSQIISKMEIGWLGLIVAIGIYVIIYVAYIIICHIDEGEKTYLKEKILRKGLK